MTTPEIWSAAKNLADCFKATPKVVELNELAPADITKATGHRLAKLLNEIDAGGGGVTRHPLQLFTQIRFGLSLPGNSLDGIDQNEFEYFVRLAEQVEVAHRALVAWLRSRLPGYPLILTPHLVRDTIYTTEDYTYKYPWLRADLAAGLQFHPRPVLVADLLSAPDSRLADAAHELASTLRASDEWKKYAAAQMAVSDVDTAELKRARTELRHLLSPQQLDAYEPRLALRRLAYRDHHTKHVVDSLTGAAREFALAFDAVNDLIDLAAVDVLAQLVRFDEPASLTPETLEFDQDADGYVTVHLRDEGRLLFLRPGRLARIDHALITDAARVDGVGFSMDDDVATLRVTCLLLGQSDGLLLEGMPKPMT
jgi:cell fate (sporulation/competence/biofilm development) regulator YlbF (YheA/YmcA/DUF963 family)